MNAPFSFETDDLELPANLDAVTPSGVPNLTAMFNDPLTFQESQRIYMAHNPQVRRKRIRIGEGRWVDEVNRNTGMPILQIPGDLRFFDIESSELYGRQLVVAEDGKPAVEILFYGRMDRPLATPETVTTLKTWYNPDTKRDERIMHEGQAILGSTYWLRDHVVKRNEAYANGPEGAAQRAKADAYLKAEREARVARYRELKAELDLMKAEIVELKTALEAAEAEEDAFTPVIAKQVAEKTNLFFLLREAVIDLRNTLVPQPVAAAA